MGDFDLQSMDKVVVFVGVPDEAVRRELRQLLKRAGVKQISAHANLENLKSLVGKIPPDLIIVADDLDPQVFDFIRDIRHNKLGSNPFVLIMTIVAPDHREGVKGAMQAGTDDIIVKPLKEKQLLQRLKRVMTNRSAFVVTSDYLGPDRRPPDRPSAIQRINVPNTMREKVSGKDVDAGDVRDAVDGSMTEVLQARLDSHGLRMGFVSNLILEAFKTKNIAPEIRDKILALADVLKDAAKTAERLEERDLAILCGSLSADVMAIAERYLAPTAKDIDLIEKLSKAVVLAMKPRSAPDKLEEENRQAAATYQQRQRADFKQTQEIQRASGEAPVVTVDEPVIEILPLAKGQFLFKQGDVATSAYILNNGVIGIFKEVDGKRQPVARVKKGEFFGELAIIDGRLRRNSAMALEDCTLSLVSKDMIEEKLAGSDPLIRGLLQMLSNSMRVVHESYAAKGRNVADAVMAIKEQAHYVQSELETGSAQRRKDGAAAAKKIAEATNAIVSLIESMPDLDRRRPAVPAEKDVTG